MNTNFIRTLLADTHHLFERYEFTFEPHPFMPVMERLFLEKQYLEATSILEFGSGGSTLFAIANGKNIVSVESDRKFFNYLMSHIENTYRVKNAKIFLANTGITGRYGTPIFYPLTANVSKKALSYILTGYSQFSNSPPDLIFVDGRWRVSCCLYALIVGFFSSQLILDDYEIERSYKTIIEKYFDIELNGRIALLTPKSGIDVVELVPDFIISLDNPE